MRFAARFLGGLVLTLVTVGLLGAAGWRLFSAMSAGDDRPQRPAKERSYVVDTGVLAPRSVAPVITAFGQAQAWRTLEIRAPAAGPVTEISDNFRDGLTVAAGELLFRIDPENAERRVIDAKAALAQAETEHAEALASQRHLEAELASAQAQAAVRRGDLARKQSLADKKLLTSSLLDEARLALSAAEQAVTAKEQEIIALRGRIERAEAGVARARLTLNDTEKALTDTSYRAPFDGRLTDVALTLGRRVVENEKLALLIDPTALEVAFPVRNSDFGNLLDPGSRDRLARLPVEVSLDLAAQPITVKGHLERPAAVAATQSGRTVFARLDGAEASALRPGDFVTVRITEPAIEGVAVIPAGAATIDGRILLVNEQARLVEHQARVVRRQGEEILVADVPFGATYVRRRLPFLSGGVKVEPRSSGQPQVTESAARVLASADQPGRRGAGAGGDRAGNGATDDGASDGMVIDESRRAALIAHVMADDRMPDERRQRILEELAKPAPSRRLVERIEQRMSRGGQSRS